MSSQLSTTFQVFNVTPEIYNQTGFPSENATICQSEHVVTYLREYNRNNCTRVLGGTQFSKKTRPTAKNGFINTVLKCYAGHHNLVIRPEDIWIVIMTQFSLYINANSEEFRKKFVNFDGKKELEVKADGTLFTAPYDYLIRLMTEKIDKNLIDEEFKLWILPNFTTTTPDDLVTTGAIFMATMKNYFDYTFSVMCGIPNITLEGTAEDYEEILSRLTKLESYKLEKWVAMLKPILQQFIDAKKGNVDLDFWKRIVNFNHGCGRDPDTISGWITVFMPIDKDGKWKGDNKRNRTHWQWDSKTNTSIQITDSTFGEWPTISFKSIPSGLVEADVKIIYNGTEYESVLFSGHMAYELLDDNVSLRPKIGWAIALKNFTETDDNTDYFQCNASEKKELGIVEKDRLARCVVVN